MAKKKREVTAMLKIQIPAGQANPAPPIGSALGPHGINIMDFCKQFNSQTADKAGLIIPAEISIYKDRTFSFILKTPPAAVLIKKELALAKGSGEPNKNKVGTIKREQLRKIAQMKMVDLNANDIEAGAEMIAGTCRSMGVDVIG